MPKVGDVVFAGVFDGGDHAFDSAVSEAAGDYDSVVAAEDAFYVVVGDVFGLDPADFNVGAVCEAAVGEGFGYREVGVVEFDVFADEGDFYCFVGFFAAGEHVGPFAEVGFVLDAEAFADDVTETFFFEEHRDFVDAVGGEVLDYALFFDVAEECEFLLHFFGELHFGAADEDVGLDSYREEFLDAVLGGL